MPDLKSKNKKPGIAPAASSFPVADLERYKNLPLDEVVADMADSQKVELANVIVQQVIQNQDPSALKMLNGIMEKQGFDKDKELPISDERFQKIIEIAARGI